MRKAALDGIRVIELGGLAPVPFCGMMLADFGADVLRVDRLRSGPKSIGMAVPEMNRHKRSIELDLRSEEGAGVLRKMARHADVLIEPFRPGVMEKLTLGPDTLCEENERLIYARLTGFGQGGLPHRSGQAGHDLNYLARSGILSALRAKNQSPNPPVNLLADFAGGSSMCAIGILLALLERSNSGLGQVVDAAMVDGTAYLSTFVWKMIKSGLMSNENVGTSLLDGGAPFYTTYRCLDDQFVAVGCLEPQFFQIFVELITDATDDLPERDDMFDMYANRERWQELQSHLGRVFEMRTRDEWAETFEGTDACVTPVLSIREAERDPHHIARNAFSFEGNSDEIVPCPAPRLSDTPAKDPRQYDVAPRSYDYLTDFGICETEARRLLETKDVAYWE